MTIHKGKATAEGTRRFRDRFAAKVSRDHFRESRQRWFSSIGMGSYLGTPDAETDRRYEEAFLQALSRGVNVFDSAINYRCQRSERSFGRALSSAIGQGLVRRDEIILCTKAGFLPFDEVYPEDPMAFFEHEYVRPGFLAASELSREGHSLSVKYLENQLSRSLENLGVETVDIFYLHNPEVQLGRCPRDEFLSKIRSAFEWLEEKIREGKISSYGVATWDGFRTAPDAPGYLGLEELVVTAREAGGAENGFRYVQLPFNVVMPEAWVLSNQGCGGGAKPVLSLMERYGLSAITSATLLQARLAGEIPPFFRNCFPEARTPAQCSIQFSRSVPGVTTALVGMSSASHVEENLETAALEVVSESELVRKFQQQ